MSFHKLSKEERAEWRNLPATKAMITHLRDAAQSSARMALFHARGGAVSEVAFHAGAEQATTVIADTMEKD